MPSSIISCEAPIEQSLLELELGDAVAQQPADAIGALEDGDGMAGAIQLLRGCKSGGPRADDGDAAAGARFGRLRHHPALVEGAVDDRDLDRLDA